MALLDVEDLTVEFVHRTAPLRAVDGVSLSVSAGEVLGIVGESGSGKSVTALALMGLIEEPGQVRAARLSLDGRDLLTMPARAAPVARPRHRDDLPRSDVQPEPVLHGGLPVDRDTAYPRRRPHERTARAGAAASARRGHPRPATPSGR